MRHGLGAWLFIPKGSPETPSGLTLCIRGQVEMNDVEVHNDMQVLAMLSSKEINTLRQRWSDATTAIALEYLNGKTQAELSLTPQGLVDLQGVAIEDFIKDKQLQDLDLSACVLKGFGQFGFCRFENCNFSDAALGTNLGRQFFRCNFQKANLQNAVLRGEFQDCDFDGARLVAASGNQIKFCRCSFRQTNFKRAILLNCVFEDCVMENCVFGGGSLGKAKFEHTNVDEVDFSDTILDGTSYT